MGNFASKGESYSKPESDDRFPLKTVFDTTIKTVNAGLADRYTKTESDDRYPLTTELKTGLAADFNQMETKRRDLEVKLNNTQNELSATKTEIINQIKSLASAENVYTKTDADTTFLKKVDAANMVSDYATVAFVTNKFAEMEKSVTTGGLNIGGYSLTNTDSQLCLKKNDGTQSFCFDGKIVIQK